MSDDLVMMSPFRLRASLAATLRGVAAKRGCSMTFIIREALKDWLAKHGEQDLGEVENLRRLEEKRKEREAREAAEKVEAERGAERRLIEHLEHWRRHGGGRPYPFLNGRTCPAGFEDVIQGAVEPVKEEEI